MITLSNMKSIFASCLAFSAIALGWADEPTYLQWTKTVWHNDANMAKSFETASLWKPECTPTNSPNNYLCWQQEGAPEAMLNQWIQWPSANVTLWGVANSSPFQVFLMKTGGGRFYSLYDAANSPAVWYAETGAVHGGFATRGSETLQLDRVAVVRQIAVKPIAADHEIAIRNPMGQSQIENVGPGKLTLNRPFRGGVLLSNGSVEIGQPVTEVERPAGVPFFRFDAADEKTMTCTQDAHGILRLTRWNDAEGGSQYVYGPAQNGNYAWVCPQLGPETVNGVKLVNFGAYSEKNVCPSNDAPVYGESAMLDYGPTYKPAKEVFFVGHRTTPGYMMTPFEYWDSNGPDVKGAFHLQGNGIGLLQTGAPLAYGGEGRVNGAPVYSRTDSYVDYHSTDDLQIYHIASTNMVPVWHCGGMKGLYVAGGLVLAEAIAYTNNLTESERIQTTRYLAKKWTEKGKTDLAVVDLSYLEILKDGTVVRVPSGKEATVRTVTTPNPKGGSFVKIGGGTLVLDRVDRVDLEVREGDVKFAHDVADDYAAARPAANPHFWGDATKADRFFFEKDEEGHDTTRIAAWRDCRADVLVTMTNNYIKATTLKSPTYNAAGPRGLPCVDFGAAITQDGARLGLSSKLNAEGKPTYSAFLVEGFIVWRNLAGKDAAPRIFSDYAAVSFARDKNSLCTWASSDDLNASGQWSVDGAYMCPTNGFYGKGVDDWVVIRYSSSRPVFGNSLAGYRTNDGGGIQVGEFLFYDRALTDAERRKTEAYLLRKWKGQRHPDENRDAFGRVTFAEGVSPVLEVEGERDFVAVEASAPLVKRGSGEATIKSLSDAALSGLSVEEGSLSVSLEHPAPTVLKTSFYHYDASDLSSMVTETNNGVVTVKRLNHASGNDVGGYASEPNLSLTVTNLPRLVTETIAGVPRTVIDFGEYCSGVKDANGVYQIPLTATAGVLKPSSSWKSCAEIYLVFRDTDSQKRKALFGSWEYFADRGSNGALFQGNQSHTVFNNYWLDVDGVSVPYNHSLADGWHVVSLASESDKVALCQFGVQIVGPKIHMGGQQLAEMIAFEERHDAATRTAIRDYLRAKWLRTVGEHSKSLGSVSVASGASVKFAASGYDSCYQVSALSGGGSYDFDGVPLTGVAALSAEVDRQGVVSCAVTSSQVTFADDVTVSLTFASPQALNLGRYPILTAGGLGNADAVSSWSLNLNLVPRRDLSLVRDGDSICLDVKKRGFILMFR